MGRVQVSCCQDHKGTLIPLQQPVQVCYLYTDWLGGVLQMDIDLAAAEKVVPADPSPTYTVLADGLSCNNKPIVITRQNGAQK